MDVKLTCLDDLSEKLELIVQNYVALKKEKARVDQVLAKKNKENSELRRILEKQVKERKQVVQRIDNLINKIKTIE